MSFRKVLLQANKCAICKKEWKNLYKFDWIVSSLKYENCQVLEKIRLQMHIFITYVRFQQLQAEKTELQSL